MSFSFYSTFLTLKWHFDFALQNVYTKREIMTYFMTSLRLIGWSITCGTVRELYFTLHQKEDENPGPPVARHSKNLGLLWTFLIWSRVNFSLSSVSVFEKQVFCSFVEFVLSYDEVVDMNRMPTRTIANDITFISLDDVKRERTWLT